MDFFNRDRLEDYESAIEGNRYAQESYRLRREVRSKNYMITFLVGCLIALAILTLLLPKRQESSKNPPVTKDTTIIHFDPRTFEGASEKLEQ